LLIWSLILRHGDFVCVWMPWISPTSVYEFVGTIKRGPGWVSDHPKHVWDDWYWWCLVCFAIVELGSRSRRRQCGLEFVLRVREGGVAFTEGTGSIAFVFAKKLVAIAMKLRQMDFAIAWLLSVWWERISGDGRFVLRECEGWVAFAKGIIGMVISIEIIIGINCYFFSLQINLSSKSHNKRHLLSFFDFRSKIYSEIYYLLCFKINSL